MKKLFLICLLFALAMPFVGFSQNPLTKEEKVQAMYDLNKRIVESQNFSFIANWVFSGDMRGEVAQNANTISITESNIHGSLATLDTDKPVMLKGSLENYSVNFDDEIHQISISFRIGVYNTTIEVKPNGIAFLELVNANGEKLKYRGGIK
ncbi:MAG: DUF4251 domain-containing protein [Winogradskyella sp.]|nr:DUF4251 domain-containing protein [Winogradskyella sp.]